VNIRERVRTVAESTVGMIASYVDMLATYRIANVRSKKKKKAFRTTPQSVYVSV
jgi:hypothetical protein